MIRVHHTLALLALATLLALPTPRPVDAARAQLAAQPGEPFPDMAFEELVAPEDYESLGLSKQHGEFRLAEIPGELLILEFFNRHCLTCRRQAPYLAAFFRAVREGELRERVRVLAVGVGNRAKHLAEFRQELKAYYPIAPDPFFERFLELGDPGGTPFTVFLTREEGRWILTDFHMGLQGDAELLARSRVLLSGAGVGARAEKLEKKVDLRPPLGLDAAEQARRAAAFLSQVAAAEVSVQPVELAGGVRVFRGLDRSGAPLGLYARIASRDPVCDLCHAVHFLLAFDDQGRVTGFEPIHVTKYGNEIWSAQDHAKLESRLAGRQMAELSFDPELDAVTSATMSSALIFDEARRTARLLAELRSR